MAGSQTTSQFRWTAALALWTALAGPVFVAPAMWLRSRLFGPPPRPEVDADTRPTPPRDEK